LRNGRPFRLAENLLSPRLINRHRRLSSLPD
jgi:hypothetical protein